MICSNISCTLTGNEGKVIAAMNLKMEKYIFFLSITQQRYWRDQEQWVQAVVQINKCIYSGENLQMYYF